MSAATTLLPPQGPYRFTVEQYHGMIANGILTENDPVELLEGELVFKMPKYSPHVTAVRRCRRSITPLLPVGYFFDTEQPITLSDGEPEPDGIVVHGTIDDYEASHPRPVDLPLVIEVSDSTRDRDHSTKLRSYARAGIVCYWIVNLIDRQIEVYTQPDYAAESPTYRSMEIFKAGDSVPFQIGTQLIAKFPVNELLPSA